MKRTKELFKYLFIVSCLIFSSTSVVFATESSALTVGVYETSGDEHKIEVKDDGTVLYDDTYSLTFNEVESGSTLIGKLGTDNKTVTFYQLNSSVLISGGVVSYTHGGGTVYLYDHTAFRLDITPEANASGDFEVWNNGSKVNTYVDLQSAVDAATSGDTIKINKGFDVSSGAYIAGKALTIDGNNNTLNRANWANPVFVVEEDAVVEIKNLTIDGGATGFEVDYDSVTFKDVFIPLKAGSDTNDPKQNISAIITKGDLITNNIEVNNNYTGSHGSAMKIISGTATINNSSFNHNRALGSDGGAIYIGSDFKENQTEYPVKSITIANSEFSENYATDGGAINLYNTANLDVVNTNFTSNVTTGSNTANGGAIRLWHQGGSNGYYSKGAQLGLDFVDAKFKGCLFDGNWAGNDGSAIHYGDAKVVFEECTFQNNVGTHPTSSVGTISNYTGRGKIGEYAYTKIYDCIIKNNKGRVSVFGDHGGMTDFEMDGCELSGNVGGSDFLLYICPGIITNTTFSNETAYVGVIDARARIDVIAEPYYKEPILKLENVSFENTNGATDVLLRTHEHGTTFTSYKAEVAGTFVGDIHVWDESILSVDEDYTGTIYVDKPSTLADTVTNKSDAEVIYHEDSYTILMNYGKDDMNIDMYKILYLENGKTYTPTEIYLMTGLEKEGYKLEWYSSNQYTTAWNYTVSANATVYGKWVEHEHTFGEELIMVNNILVEACACGYFDKSLKLAEPINLVYDGNTKEVSVINTLELPETEYTLEYKQQKDSDWEAIESAPSNVGLYKAVLTTSGDKVIELEYTITKATPVIAISNLSQKDVSITSVTYTITPEVTDGIVKIEYKESTAEDSSYTETLPTAAGTYSVRVTLTGDSNLEDAEKVETLSITKRTSSGGSSVTRYKIEVIESEGGTITPGTYRVKKGSDKTFEIEAEEGYEIEDVLVDGESIGAVTEYKFENVKTKHTIEAKFKMIEEEWENPFKDVAEDDWFYEAVKYTNENKLINGMSANEFGGKVSTTRGMIVTILYRYAKAQTIEESTFDDVAEGSYYSNAIAWAAKNEIVKGMGDNKFAPDAEITREQLATILYRFAVKNEMDVSVGENTNILSYDDFNEISEYAIPAFQWACGSGIITGRTTSTLSPKETATRAEVATMLMRFCEYKN